MADISAYTLNGTSIKRPDSFKIERFKTTNMKRLADSSMTGVLIAKKLKFSFTYNSITATDLDAILDIIWESNSLFFTLGYAYQGENRTARVYVGSIPSDLHRTGGEWVWKDVAFNLIQQ